MENKIAEGEGVKQPKVDSQTEKTETVENTSKGKQGNKSMKIEESASTTRETHENYVPYTRFKEVVDEKNKWYERTNELKNEMKQTEEMITKMKSELETEHSIAEEWRTYQADRRQTLLGQLPEDERVIYENLPLEKLEQHIVIRTKKSITHGIPGGTEKSFMGNPFEKMTKNELKANWEGILAKYIKPK